MPVRSIENRLFGMPVSIPCQAGALALLGNAIAVMAVWRQRAETRARLRELDSYRLDDIGVTAAERAREVRKPFWVR